MFALISLLLRLLVWPSNVRDIALENLALRQQLTVFKRHRPRLRLRKEDRLFWVCLSMTWKNWRQALLIVKPETVVSWHRRGFRLFWSWISRRKGMGRPEAAREIRELIRKMAAANPLWGAPKIHGELLKYRDFRTYGFPINAQEAEAFLPDLEGFLEQPCPGSGLGGFLHGSNGYLSRPVCLDRAGSSPPACDSL